MTTMHQKTEITGSRKVKVEKCKASIRCCLMCDVLVITDDIILCLIMFRQRATLFVRFQLCFIS